MHSTRVVSVFDDRPIRVLVSYFFSYSSTTFISCFFSILRSIMPILLIIPKLTKWPYYWSYTGSLDKKDCTKIFQNAKNISLKKKNRKWKWLYLEKKLKQIENIIVKFYRNIIVNILNNIISIISWIRNSLR